MENQTTETEIIAEKVGETKPNYDSNIPKERFSKVIGQRNELRADYAELEIKFNDLQTKLTESQSVNESLTTKFTDMESEIGSYREAETKQLNSQWEEKVKLFNVKSGDVNFDKIAKIKSRFQFPKENEQLSIDEIKQNLKTYETYDEINYFDNVSVNSPEVKKAVTDKSTTKTGKKYFGYGSYLELAQNDWKLAAQWKRENQ